RGPEPARPRSQPRRGRAVRERPRPRSGVRSPRRRAAVRGARDRPRGEAMTPGPALALVAPEEDPGVSPDTMLLGLPLARRTALAARRAGFSRVEAIRATPALAAALDGTGAALVDAPSPGATPLPWNVVVHIRDLKKLAGGASPVGLAVRSPSDMPRAEDVL